MIKQKIVLVSDSYDEWSKTDQTKDQTENPKLVGCGLLDWSVSESEGPEIKRERGESEKLKMREWGEGERKN